MDGYKSVAEQVTKIWKEHGALSYSEFVGKDGKMTGIRSFPGALDTTEEDAIIFGWVVFDSKASRDRANELVINDPRMTELIAPLTDPSKLIFNAQRMVYGGFQAFVWLNRPFMQTFVLSEKRV